MNEAVLVGGPHDGATIETETDGPDELQLGQPPAVYRRAGKVEGRWVFQWVPS